MHIGCTRSVSGITAFSTVCMKKTLLALTMLTAIGSAAQADTVKFYNGGDTYTGAFSGAGSVYAVTSGAATDCPVGSPGCTLGGAPDILSASQTFLVPTIITATANLGQNVWNDLSPPFAGLGVGLASQGNDADQILGTDVLTIHFNALVTLTGVATLFEPGHDPFGPETAATIGGTETFLINGVSLSLLLANFNGLSITGHDFTFAQDGGTAPSFYVSALQFRIEQEDTPTTPIPGAVWLFGGGLGLVAMLSGRRKRKQKSVWETTTSA